MNQDQAFLEFVVKGIVGKPEAVKVARGVDERGVLLTLDVDVSDIGYVIGRQGQTAHAIRTLLRIVGAKNNARVNLKINEPIGGKHSRPMMAPTAASDVVDTSAVDDLNI
ncbi:MAG: KH domain-containing protein [Candidatus Magasanikbacteria bacterium]|nr:KH domain-containing protein [Candidatus Magasanikbacteria bacterium]